MYCFRRRPTYCWHDTYCLTRQKDIGISIHIAAAATQDIGMTIYTASSMECIVKPLICSPGQLRNVLKGKYRVTYRIVQGVKIYRITCHILHGVFFVWNDNYSHPSMRLLSNIVSPLSTRDLTRAPTKRKQQQLQTSSPSPTSAVKVQVVELQKGIPQLYSCWILCHLSFDEQFIALTHQPSGTELYSWG